MIEALRRWKLQKWARGLETSFIVIPIRPTDSLPLLFLLLLDEDEEDGFAKKFDSGFDCFFSVVAKKVERGGVGEV